MENMEKKVNQKQENLLTSRDYQVKKLKELIDNLGQGYWWYQSIRTGYNIGPTFEPGTHENYVQLEILSGLFQEGSELVAAIQDNWFDEGGKHVSLIIANNEARNRVLKKVDCLAPEINRISAFEYVSDMHMYPEDYLLIGSGPI